MFPGCCIPYLPIVLQGNHLKNKLYYPKYKAGTYDDPDIPYKDDPDLLHVIKMETEPIFKGLPIMFNDDFPWDNEKIESRIHPDQYNPTIISINSRIEDHTLCTGWIVVYFLLAFFTCGLTLIPLCLTGSKAISEIDRYLERRNEQVFRKNGIEWRLQAKYDERPISWIEIWNIETDNDEIEELV